MLGKLRYAWNAMMCLMHNRPSPMYVSVLTYRLPFGLALIIRVRPHVGLMFLRQEHLEQEQKRIDDEFAKLGHPGIEAEGKLEPGPDDGDIRSPDTALEEAIDNLQWDIRWLYHMWCSRGSTRWKTREVWRGYLERYSLRQIYEGYKRGWVDGHNRDLPYKVTNIIVYLLGHWFGIALTTDERAALTYMLEPRYEEEQSGQDE